MARASTASLIAMSEPAGLALAEDRFLIDDVVRYVVARRPPAPPT